MMSIFRKHIAFRALSSSALVLALLISGCSSNSGGDDPVTPPVETQSTISSLSVQGRLFEGASGGALAATASLKSLDGVLVTAKLYNATTLLDTLYTQTDSNGAYRLPFSQTDLTPDRVALTFEKEGFVVGEKVLQVGSSNELVQDMRLGPEVVVTQTRADLAFSASGAEKFRFGIVRQSDGSIAAIAGGDYSQARAAAAGSALLDVAIPVGSLDSEVEAVTARLAHFDPNDSSQVQSFPGDFVGSGALGSGEGIDTGSGANASTANSDEYRLISSVFSQVRLQDQNGEELTLSDAAAVTAAAETPAIYLQVPSQSYATITEDVDAILAGIQVPIYVYRGGWEYAGNGMLVTYDSTSPQADGNGYVTYAGTLPLPTDGSVAGLYVRIAITAGNDWIQWVNLDWPIQAGVSVMEICFDANIVYAGDPVENYSGYMDIRLPDGGYDWQYIDDGEFQFSVNTLGDPSNPADWRFDLWNNRIGQYESIDLQAFSSFTTGSTCNDLGSVELTNPLRYSLYGRMSKNGEAASGRVVYVYGNGFLDWDVTDLNGNYQMSIPSDLLAVEVGSEINRLVQVNGTVDNDENADNGNAVQLDIALPNLAPVITGLFAPSTLTIPATAADVQASLVASAYDVDSSEIQLSWGCVPSATCSMSAPAATASAYVSNAQIFSTTASGSYSVTVTAADGDGGTSSRTATIDVTQGNRAPRAIAVDKVNTSVTSSLSCVRQATYLSCSDNLRTNDVIEYKVQAFDADGDAISYTWDVDASCTTRSCTMPTASTSGNVIIDLSDGNSGSDQLRISINVTQNQVPEILYMFAAPSAVMVNGNGKNSQAISLEGFAVDDVLVASYLWTLKDSSAVDIPITGGASTADIAVDTLDEGIYVATLAVTDDEGASTSGDLILRVYSNAPPSIDSATATPAVVGSNGNGNNAEAIVLSMVATDPEGDALSYYWMIDGSTRVDAAMATLAVDSLTAGVHTAVAHVRDISGGSDSATVNFRINSAPVIENPGSGDLSYGPLDAISIDARATDDFDTVLDYSWSIAGTTQTGANLSFASGALSVGSHAITLTVTDGDGASSNVAFNINIVDLAPVIVSPAEGGIYTFGIDRAISITANVTDDSSGVLSYSWSVNGNSYSGTSLQLAAGILVEGSYPASLTVTDSNGGSATVSFTIEITTVPSGNLEVIVQ